MKSLPTIKHPHWRFTASLPLTRNPHIKKPVRITKCGLGFFGCSAAVNETWTLFVFGWALCELKRLQWNDESDKERADRYLAEWSKCEKELRGLRLIVMGEGMSAEVKKLIRDSMGVDFEEGRSE